MPPASPAWIMLRNRSSNVFLCLPSASASVEPASTSRVTSAITRANAGFDVCAARMSRHCTSGRPAEIMVANWRVKIAISFVLTLPAPGIANWKPFDFSLSEVTMMRFLRRKSTASSWRSKVSSPAWDSPAMVRPFQTKTGMRLSRWAGD